MKEIPKYKEVAKKYSNMNVEVGEKTLLPTGLLVDHGGDKHSEGGTDVNLPEGAMIFSNAMKLDKNVVALLLNKDKSKVKRMTPAELAKKYATNELLENIESPDKYKANSAKLMLEKNIAQLNSIFQAQEEHKKVNGIESGKTLAEQGMKAEYGTAKYGGVAQSGIYSKPTPNPQLNGFGQFYKPELENRALYNFNPVNSGMAPKWVFDPITGDYTEMTPGYSYNPESRTMESFDRTGGNWYTGEANKMNVRNADGVWSTNSEKVPATEAQGIRSLITVNPEWITDGVVKDEKIGAYFDKQTGFNRNSGKYELENPDNKGLNQQTLQHLILGDNEHIPAMNAYKDHYTAIVTDATTGQRYRLKSSTVPTDQTLKDLPTIDESEVLKNLTNYTVELPSPDGKEANAFAHDFNYNDAISVKVKDSPVFSPFENKQRLFNPFGSELPVTNPYGAPKPPVDSTTPNVVQKPMTDYAIKSHNQIAADLYRKLFSAEMQAPYEIFNPGIAPVVRPAYQSTAPVQQALNNLSYTLDNSNASTQYGNALYAEGLAKSLDSANQISRYNQQAAMEAEQKNTGNLVNVFNQNQQGFAANANQNNLNFLKAKDRYELYKDDLFSRVLENQVDRNTYEGMLQDRRLTERYSPSELLDNGAWNNFFDPQRYMQFDNKDTLNPDNGQKLASLSQDELTQLKTARDNETDPTLKAKLWELYLKAIESKSQSGGYLKKKGSYQTGTIRTDSPYKYNWGSSAPMAKPETGDYSTSVSKSDLIARQRKADEIGSQADKILQMKPIGTSNSQISWYQSLTPEELNILKQSKYASKLQPIEAQIRIADSNEANKQGFIAGLKDPELMRRQSQAIGDKLGIPLVPDVIDPLTYIGQIASNLGSVPSDIQRGNYGSAALSVVEPLALGAIGTVGAKNTRQWVNNIANPLVGVDSKKPISNEVMSFAERLDKIPNRRFSISQEDKVSRMSNQRNKILNTKSNDLSIEDLRNPIVVENDMFGNNNIVNLKKYTQPMSMDTFDNGILNWKSARNDKFAGDITNAGSARHNVYWGLSEDFNNLKEKGDWKDYLINQHNNLTPLQKEAKLNLIKNHEIDHYLYKNSRAEFDDLIKAFDPEKFGTSRGYLVGKKSNIAGDELRARMGQLKDYFEFKVNPNGLEQDVTGSTKFTREHLDYALKNYIKDVGYDNNMKDFLNGIKDKDLFVKHMNKYALGLSLPIGITAATQQNQVGGISDNDKNSNEITQNNSNLNWIQRGLFPEKYPYLTEGSDKKTHRLATAGFDDGTMVFPTIVQNKDRSLVEFDIDKALDYAMKTNTGVMVKDPQLADYYSKNGLIKHYQTGVKVTNYVKPIVPLQKYLTIDTIVPQQVNPIVSTPLVQRVKQTLFPSNIVTPVESGYSSHSKASDKIYEQQTGGFNHNTFNKILYGDMQSGGVNSLFPSTTILNQQDIVRKELQDYFKSLGKVNATKRLNDMKNEYVSSNNNMNTKYQIPLIQEAYLMAYPVEMVPKSKSKRY